MLQNKFILGKREFSLVLGRKKRTIGTDFVAQSRTTLYILQQLFSTYNSLICRKAALDIGGKTRNIAIQLVLQ